MRTDKIKLKWLSLSHDMGVYGFCPTFPINVIDERVNVYRCGGIVVMCKGQVCLDVNSDPAYRLIEVNGCYFDIYVYKVFPQFIDICVYFKSDPAIHLSLSMRC
jgi:hypothetical protein